MRVFWAQLTGRLLPVREPTESIQQTGPAISFRAVAIQYFLAHPITVGQTSIRSFRARSIQKFVFKLGSDTLGSLSYKKGESGHCLPGLGEGGGVTAYCTHKVKYILEAVPKTMLSPPFTVLEELAFKLNDTFEVPVNLAKFTESKKLVDFGPDAKLKRSVTPDIPE